MHMAIVAMFLTVGHLKWLPTKFMWKQILEIFFGTSCQLCLQKSIMYCARLGGVDVMQIQTSIGIYPSVRFIGVSIWF